MPLSRDINRRGTRGTPNKTQWDYDSPELEADSRGLHVWGLDKPINPEQDLVGRKLKPPDEKPPEAGKIRQYVIGIDIGLKHDRSAIAILDVRYKDETPHALLVHFERLLLGTVFKRVAARVKNRVEGLKKYATKSGAKCDITVLVDATGMGAGPAEMIRDIIPNEDVRFVQITSGESARVGDETIHLSKSLMVSNLLAMFESRYIHINPNTSMDIEGLMDELNNFDLRLSEETGVESYGAKSGKYDDYITAIGLPAWWAMREESKPPRMW